MRAYRSNLFDIRAFSRAVFVISAPVVDRLLGDDTRGWPRLIPIMQKRKEL